MSARVRWPLAIAGCLLACVLAMVILAVTAATHPPQVIPTYYKEAR